jgi:hypothetical protein
MAYPETYATMIDLISQKLQDTGNAVWTDAELLLYITEGLREISQYHPYIYRCEFNLESRTGTATADTANALVDTTNSQFLAGDVGKWVYNSEDRTWAVVTAYAFDHQLTLSKDIFPDGNEPYQIFNKECTDSKEFNINAPQSKDGALGSRAFDWLYIDKIEYPILQDPPSYLLPGQWELQENHIVRLKISDEPDNTKNADAADEVWVYFALQHQLSRLTGFLGKIDLVAGYAAGLTSIHVDDMTADEIIYKGQMFQIDDVRGIYIADYQRTLTSGESDITFFPPLMDATVDGATVRFISNTMDYKLEGLFADLVAGKAAINKASLYIGRIGPGPNRYRYMLEWGKIKYGDAKAELEGLTGFVAPSVTLP